MFFTKAFETKVKLSPELSVSLLRSLEVTQRLASTVARSNSASHFHGSFDGSRLKLSKTLFTKAFKTQQNAFYESVLGRELF
ncbi:hypothetical protein [Leptospira kirschneri]|uniref:hypothetical protein n=1 Tax=Leptospira kirschneri TaxID=29507 RepID=UPI00046C5B12|nr:hypothetical protein [Leptospira kirschneri]